MKTMIFLRSSEDMELARANLRSWSMTHDMVNKDDSGPELFLSVSQEGWLF